jgi:hypothetical protein
MGHRKSFIVDHLKASKERLEEDYSHCTFIVHGD